MVVSSSSQNLQRYKHAAQLFVSG